LDRYFTEKLANVRRLLPQARAQLKFGGVAKVKIDYDGCGDSGQIEDVSFWDANDQPVAFVLGELTQAQLQELFYDLLETRHAGWENNDGAFGDFQWDLETDTLNHTHHSRYTDYETSEYEGV